LAGSSSDDGGQRRKIIIPAGKNKEKRIREKMFRKAVSSGSYIWKKELAREGWKTPKQTCRTKKDR